MKNSRGNGLVYAGDVGKVSTYEMYVDHRVVFRVTVDNDDPELAIHVHRVDGTGGHETKGRAQRNLFSYYVKNPDGTVDTTNATVQEHVDPHSVHTYVYPRLPMILADLYVPKTPVDSTASASEE